MAQSSRIAEWVLEQLRRSPVPVPGREIARRMERPYQSVQSAIARLEELGKLRRVGVAKRGPTPGPGGFAYTLVNRRA